MLVQYDHIHFCLTWFSTLKPCSHRWENTADTDSITDHLMWCVWVWWMLESIFQSLILCDHIHKSAVRDHPESKTYWSMYLHHALCRKSSSQLIHEQRCIKLCRQHCKHLVAMVTVQLRENADMWCLALADVRVDHTLVIVVTLTHYTSWCYRIQREKRERERM